MPPIYVNTENDPKNKIFNASKAGGASAEAEALMKKKIIDLLAKNATFTTNKYDKAKGYTIKMELTEVNVDGGGNTACKMSTIIERYPDGNIVSTGGTSNAKVGPPADKQAILDCVGAMVEGALTKSLKIMTEDMAKNR